MPYDYPIGVDFHKAYSQIAVQESSGKTLRSGRVRNDRRSVESFLAPFSDNAYAVVEACRNWPVMYDWLDEICDDVVLTHPLKVKAIAEGKIKTDKIDATILSHLLRADLVPIAHAPSHQAPELRHALRERMFSVGLRTMVKNGIVTAFDRYPEQTAQLKRCTDLFGTGESKQLAELEVSELDRIQIGRSLAFIADINRRIKDAEATAKALSKGNANVKRLKTIPGIGEFFARLIDAEIDDINRFRSAQEARGLCRDRALDLCERRQDLSRPDHQAGQQVAALGLVEAVAPAVASDPELKELYQRLSAKGSNRAKMAVARRLATIAFQVLREKRSCECHRVHETRVNQFPAVLMGV